MEVTDALGSELGACKRCGRPVYERHSYVMLVPVGRGRMFFHAGCEPLKRPPDATSDTPKRDRQDPRE